MNDMDTSDGRGRADLPADSRPDTRWLSYRELADVLAPMKFESVVRLVRRKKWPKRDSNSGVRVAVPADALADMLAKRRDGQSNANAARPDVLADEPTDIRADMSRTIKALEAALSAMGEQMAALRSDQERARTEWAEQIAALRTELDKAKADAADQRSRADRAEGLAEGLKAARLAPSGFAAWWRSVREAFRPEGRTDTCTRSTMRGSRC